MENSESSEVTRTCPACGKKLGNEMHRAKPFEIAPGIPQIQFKRFWLCDTSVEWFEQMIKIYREAKYDQFVNVP